MFEKMRSKRKQKETYDDLLVRKEFIYNEMDKAEVAMRKAIPNSAEYDDYKKIYMDWSEKYNDILKTECDIRKKDSERKDSKIKTVVYTVGTILSIVGVAGLSLLYAVIDNVGSTGREAKNWLREIWKNRPIFK